MKLLNIMIVLLVAVLFLSSNAYCEDLCADMDYENSCVFECPSCCNLILSKVQMVLSSANDSSIDAWTHYFLYQQPYINIPHRPPISSI